MAQSPALNRLSGDHLKSDYAGLKSPVDEFGRITYGEGALRPPKGSISIYSWENLGVAVHVAAAGVVYATMSNVIYAVLNNYLHMSATLVATATALVGFPRALRVFTGMLTDRVPIFGYRRRPYMVLGWSLCFVCCLLMAALPLGEPYYTDAALKKIDIDDMTPAQLKTVNLNAPNSGVKYIILMMIANFGMVLAYSGFNGALVDISQREPERLRGTAYGDISVTHDFFQVISSFMTGLGLNGVHYGGSFSWAIGFNGIMWICTAASALIIPFAIFCVQEDKMDRVPEQSVFVFLYRLLEKRHVYRFVAFSFFYNVLSLFTVTSASAIQSDWAGVEPLNSGIASMIAAILTASGVYVVKSYGLGWNWRYVIIFCQVGVVLLDVWPTFLTIWDVVRSQWFWLGVPLLEKGPKAIIGLINGLFILELTGYDGYEATLFGLSETTRAVGQPFATVLTKTVDGYFDVERKFIAEDSHHVRAQVTYVYIIMYLVNLASLVFVFCLPRQKAELRRMEQENRKNKYWGMLTIAYLLFSLFWTLMTNILSLSASTKCLRIAGGSGC